MVNEEISKKFFDGYCKPLNMVLIVAAKANVDYYEKKFNYNDDPSLTKDRLQGLDPLLSNFYLGVQDWHGKWKTREHLDFEIEGSFNIISFARSQQIGDTSFLPEKYPMMKGFRLLDYFYDEAAVGYFIDQPERGLFLFLFDADPQPLNIGFEGYLDLLVYSRGVSYWQNLILEHLNQKSYSNVSKIREHLPKLFPDFSMEGFIERYESKRLT